MNTDKHQVSAASIKKGSNLETPLHTDGATASAVENSTLLGHYAACSGTERCPETSVRNYHYTLRNRPEQRSSYILHGKSLKPEMSAAESLLGSRR
jgi:hypothetical protein